MARPLGSLFYPPHQRMLREVWRLLWLSLSAQVLLALFSFSPLDPSWSTWTSEQEFRNWMGRFGSIEADLLLQTLGLGGFFLGAMTAVFALQRQPKDSTPNTTSWLTPFCFLFSLGAVLEVVIPAFLLPWKLTHAGGIVGELIFAGLGYAFGYAGACCAAFVLLLTSSILLFNLPLFSSGVGLFLRLLKKLRLSKKPKLVPITIVSEAVPKISTPSIVPPPLPAATEVTEIPIVESYAPTKAKTFSPPKGEHRNFELPPLSLLQHKQEKHAKPMDRGWFLEKGQILVDKLRDFGVDGEIVNISPGPVITVYEFKPASGVKIKEISNLSDDLTLALSVLSVRIVAPIPGKPVVGIEIPSPEQQTVHFRDLLEETPFYDPKIRVPLLLGRLASGEPVVSDLSTMPHLLVAGATGTGKSVFVNSLITSLLYRYTPKELRLILVDPKMVELSTYDGIPHLLLPVVVDSKKAVQALRWAVDEMERRYTLLHEAGVRHIQAYNEKTKESNSEIETIPIVVVIIDEYADLMAVVPKEVELSITRLAQKARAAGIHLVLATQRPSTDVVTGLIKANFPSRLSFRVASSIDSKTILDRSGAERLLGNGDMLFHSAGFTTLKRMQGAYISDGDTGRIVDFLKTQGAPEYDPTLLQNIEEGVSGSTGFESDGDSNQLYDLAVKLVTDKGEASISLIQRHLRIGYNRAATLMEELERAGVVAPATGAGKRRPVLAGSL